MIDWFRSLLGVQPEYTPQQVLSDANNHLWAVEQSLSAIERQVEETERTLHRLDNMRDTLSEDIAEQTMALLDFDAETPLPPEHISVRAAGMVYLTRSMPGTLRNLDLQHTALERRLLALQLKQWDLTQAGNECRELRDMVHDEVPLSRGTTCQLVLPDPNAMHNQGSVATIVAPQQQ